MTVRAKRRGVPITCTSGLRISETRYAPKEALKEHYHADASISVIFSGSQCETIGRRAYERVDGSLVYKAAGIDHSSRIGNAGLHGLFIELSVEVSDMFTTSLRKPFDMASAVDVRAHLLARSASRELRRRDPGFEFAVEGLVFEMLAALQRDQSPQARGRNTQWLTRTREYLDTHFRERPSMVELAAHAGVHPSHLADAFRREYGASVGEYVRGLCVEHARRALMADELSLSAIATDAGFADQSHLTRVFRQSVGVPPGEYRRAARDLKT